MFNRFTKLSETVEITVVQDGVESKVQGFLYRCDGTTQYGMPCKLVWDRAWLAKQCADRNHRNQYQQEYQKQDGSVTKFLRQAIRRDGPRPQAQEPSSEEPAPVPVLSLADLRAQALALGFRLSRIPVAKPEAQPLKSVISDLSDLYPEGDEPAF